MKKLFILHESVFDDAFNPKKKDSPFRLSAREFLIKASEGASDYKSVPCVTRETFEHMKKMWYYKNTERILFLMAVFEVDHTTFDMNLKLDSVQSVRYLALLRPPKFLSWIVVNDSKASAKLSDLALRGISIVNTNQAVPILTDFYVTG